MTIQAIGEDSENVRKILKEREGGREDLKLIVKQASLPRFMMFPCLRAGVTITASAVFLPVFSSGAARQGVSPVS